MRRSLDVNMLFSTQMRKSLNVDMLLSTQMRKSLNVDMLFSTQMRRSLNVDMLFSTQMRKSLNVDMLLSTQMRSNSAYFWGPVAGRTDFRSGLPSPILWVQLLSFQNIPCLQARIQVFIRGGEYRNLISKYLKTIHMENNF